MKHDPSLFRIVETFRHSDSALSRVGPVWQTSLLRTRDMAARLPISVNCLRVHIEDSQGRIIEQLYAHDLRDGCR